MLTVPVRTVRTVTWQRSYDSHVAVDMAGIYWLAIGRMWFRHVASIEQWYGATWPSHGRPRGTRLLAVGVLVGLLKFYGGRMGFDPRTSPPVNALTNSAYAITPHSVSYYTYVFEII
jgi:hypothetical protein